mgnify:CR=1 FL=1
MERVLRSSETWVALIVAVGQAGVAAGWWDGKQFEQIIGPALTYVGARLISKLAKSVTITSAKGEK